MCPDGNEKCFERHAGRVGTPKPWWREGRSSPPSPGDSPAAASAGGRGSQATSAAGAAAAAAGSSFSACWTCASAALGRRASSPLGRRQLGRRPWRPPLGRLTLVARPRALGRHACSQKERGGRGGGGVEGGGVAGAAEDGGAGRCVDRGFIISHSGRALFLAAPRGAAAIQGRGGGDSAAARRDAA